MKIEGWKYQFFKIKLNILSILIITKAFEYKKSNEK